MLEDESPSTALAVAVVPAVGAPRLTVDPTAHPVVVAVGTFKEAMPLPMLAAVPLLFTRAPALPRPRPLRVITPWTFDWPFRSSVAPEFTTVPAALVARVAPLLPRAPAFPSASVPCATVVPPV